MSTMIFSGFLLGLLSSLHCVGMCGPLLLALPRRTPGRVAIYHVGRIGVYVTLGSIFGYFGRHIYLAGWQQALSLTLGVIVLTVFISRWMPVRPLFNFSCLLGRWTLRLWRSNSLPGTFLLGVANGLLPCGMVYLAIAAALTRNTVMEAAAFMALFGAGTLPMLLGVQWFGRMVAPEMRLRLRRMLPLVTAAVGVLLILRGLNLGIPYISPRLATAAGRAISCH